ncbi:PAS domain S-box protein [Candidatus Peregrinibacteria bacterium]|nr:PAS domain S-box protein [Candidatus Peregrinibacteria bacterium]
MLVNLKTKINVSLLYVEDEPDILEPIKEMLSRRVDDFSTASNGAEALEIFSEMRPNILITDIKMPVMNGIELAKKVKEIDPDVKIIITSAHSDVKYFLEAISIGIYQFILKPINKDIFFNTIIKCSEEIGKEHKLKRQNEYITKLSFAVEQSSAMVMLTDRAGRIEYINSKFTEVLGYQPSEIVGAKSNILRSDKNTEATLNEIRMAIKSGSIWQGEYLNETKNGEPLWEKVTISPITNKQGKIISYLRISEDITQKKEIQEKLRKSEERYRMLIQNLGEGIAIVDFDENFTFANKALHEILGLKKNETLIGRNLKEFTAPEQFQSIREQTKKRKQAQKSVYEMEVVRKDGEKRHLLVTATPQFDKNGMPSETHGIFQDMSSQFRLMQELKLSEERYRSLVENLGEGIAIVDFNENFTFTNPATDKIFNVPPGSLIGKSIAEYTDEHNLNIIKQQTQKRISGQSSIYEIEILWKNGERRNIIITATPQFNSNNEPIETHGIFQDITERKRLIEELRSAKEAAEQAYNIIEKKNRNITDSIEYAKGIQQAIFPSEELIQVYFPNSFILYKTKDIVSGDFPWIAYKNNINFIAAVDCTGHGVPGAFMSIVGSTLLNQALNEHNLNKPSDILEDLNQSIFRMIQTSEESGFKDGLDIALCSIDFNNDLLQFAGAFRPLIIIRDEKVIQISGDIYPIGYYFHQEVNEFTNHEFRLENNDLIYIFSDGYIHQFGGKHNKKFMLKRFKELLLKVHKLPMQTQKLIIKEEHEKWKGQREQLDDILILGIKYKKHA